MIEQAVTGAGGDNPFGKKVNKYRNYSISCDRLLKKYSRIVTCKHTDYFSLLNCLLHF
jgi:hypothetical protein